MKNNSQERKSSNISKVQMWIIRLKEHISVPVALLLILALGTLSGVGFYIKNLGLEKQLANQEDTSQLLELQSLRMSNEWLKNRVAVLQEADDIFRVVGHQEIQAFLVQYFFLAFQGLHDPGNKIIQVLKSKGSCYKVSEKEFR